MILSGKAYFLSFTDRNENMGDKAYGGDEEEIRKIPEEIDQGHGDLDKEMLFAAADIARTGNPIGKRPFVVCLGNIF